LFTLDLPTIGLKISHGQREGGSALQTFLLIHPIENRDDEERSGQSEACRKVDKAELKVVFQKEPPSLETKARQAMIRIISSVSASPSIPLLQMR
jgi:hypothetical protein